MLLVNQPHKLMDSDKVERVERDAERGIRAWINYMQFQVEIGQRRSIKWLL